MRVATRSRPQWAGRVRLARFFDDRSVFGQDYWRDKQVLSLEPDRAHTVCWYAGV